MTQAQSQTHKSELTARAKAVRAGLHRTGVHCIRRAAFCEVMRDDYRGKHSAAMQSWARGSDLATAVGRATLRRFADKGLTAWDNGTVLTDLGREVARLLSLEVSRG